MSYKEKLKSGYYVEVLNGSEYLGEQGKIIIER